MAFNVTEFRSALVGDGARPNLFQVWVPMPLFVTAPAVSQILTFMAKASLLPGSSVEVVTQNYFGRELKFAGNRKFPNWNITVINDENFAVRNAFEAWMNALNSHETNVRNTAANNTYDYAQNAKVIQYNKDGTPSKTYNFIGVFPTDVSPIQLDWGTDNQIEEFTVELAYQWWEVDGLTT